MGLNSIAIGTRGKIGEILYWQQAHLRYQVFHERLQWELPDANPETQLEQDQYDHADTIYIVVGTPVIACCRLIPTENRHMVSELWPHLLQGRTLGQRNIWEVSRFAVNTSVAGASLASAEMMLAGYLFAMEKNISSLVIVTSGPFERLLRKLGVMMHKWGHIRDTGGQSVIAGEALLTREMGELLASNCEKLQSSFNEIALAMA